MKVNIKDFNVDMQVKSSGIEFEVRTPDDSEQLGDCFVTMTGLTWCGGKKTKKNGIKISWHDFIAIMASEASIDAAIQAAKKV